MWCGVGWGAMACGVGWGGMWCCAMRWDAVWCDVRLRGNNAPGSAGCAGAGHVPKQCMNACWRRGSEPHCRPNASGRVLPTILKPMPPGPSSSAVPLALFFLFILPSPWPHTSPHLFLLPSPPHTHSLTQRAQDVGEPHARPGHLPPQRAAPDPQQEHVAGQVRHVGVHERAGGELRAVQCGACIRVREGCMR